MLKLAKHVFIRETAIICKRQVKSTAPIINSSSMLNRKSRVPLCNLQKISYTLFYKLKVSEFRRKLGKVAPTLSIQNKFKCFLICLLPQLTLQNHFIKIGIPPQTRDGDAYPGQRCELIINEHIVRCKKCGAQPGIEPGPLLP